MRYLLSPDIQVVNEDGKPLVGGKVYVYKHNKTELATVYTDFEQHLSTNPVILDTVGHNNIIVDDNAYYDVQIKKPDNTLLFSIMKISTYESEGGSGGSSNVDLIEDNGLKIVKTETDELITFTVSNNAINPVDDSEGSFVLGKDNKTDIDYTFVSGKSNEVTGDGESITVVGDGNKYTGEAHSYSTASGAVYTEIPQGETVIGYANTVLTKGYAQGNVVAGQRNNVRMGNYDYGNIIAGTGLNFTSTNSAYGNAIFGGYNTVEDQVGNTTSRGYMFISGSSNKYKETYGHGNGVVISGMSNTMEDHPQPWGKGVYESSWASYVGGASNTVSGLYGGIVYGQYNTLRGHGSYGGNSFVFGYANNVTANSTVPHMVLGYNNTVRQSDWNEVDTSNIILGNNNSLKGSYDYVIGTFNDINSDFTWAFGRGLVKNNEPGNNGKFILGQYNEDTTGTFLQIGNGSDYQHRKDVIRIDTDDTIWYRYNDEMVQLKPGEVPTNVLTEDDLTYDDEDGLYTKIKGAGFRAAMSDISAEAYWAQGITLGKQPGDYIQGSDLALKSEIPSTDTFASKSDLAGYYPITGGNLNGSLRAKGAGGTSMQTIAPVYSEITNVKDTSRIGLGTNGSIMGGDYNNNYSHTIGIRRKIGDKRMAGRFQLYADGAVSFQQIENNGTADSIVCQLQYGNTTSGNNWGTMTFGSETKHIAYTEDIQELISGLQAEIAELKAKVGD